jgi:hypothetical protein
MALCSKRLNQRLADRKVLHAVQRAANVQHTDPTHSDANLEDIDVSTNAGSAASALWKYLNT